MDSSPNFRLEPRVLREPRNCRILIVYVLSLYCVGVLSAFDSAGIRCALPDNYVPQLKKSVHKTQSSKTYVVERSVDQPMTFHTEYDSTVTNSSENATLQQYISRTIALISRQIQVKQAREDVIINWDCPYGTAMSENGTLYCIHECQQPSCGPVIIPESHLTPCRTCERDNNGTLYDCGPNTTDSTSLGVPDVHYVLYVTRVNCPDNVLGFASACYLNTLFNRPNLGFINICPYAIDILGHDRLSILIQHEIYHAIGFSAGLFAFYRDENGEPLTPLDSSGFPVFNDTLGVFQWSDRVARPVTLDWDVRIGQISRTVDMLVTPNVVREARAHYGCPSIEGVELEDDMGRPGGTRLSHFEQRIMPSESMTGTITPGHTFSRLTLALLEDTGWYKVNYDLADPFNWGRDLGCEFVTKSCKYWIDTQKAKGESILPYCDVSFERQCFPDGNFAALCNLFNLRESLPLQYQYFTSLPGVHENNITMFGGYDGFADHCPFPDVPSVFLTDDARRMVCQGDTNECDSNPCLNGGFCLDVITGYFCICTAEYEGRHCSYEKILCTSTEDCPRYKFCLDGRCNCESSRIGVNDTCIVPRRYRLQFTVTHVDGSPAVYNPSLNGDAEELKLNIEHALLNRLSRSEELLDSVVNVKVSSFYNGSLGVEAAIIALPSSTANVASIITPIVDDLVLPVGDLFADDSNFTIDIHSVVVTDVNECNAAELSDCSPAATCNNTNGGYECTCKLGYLDQGDDVDGPGRTCHDIDECASTDFNACSAYAVCNNTDGNYECTCLSGFRDTSPLSDRTGKSCTDINECSSLPCQHGAVCRNFRESYTCECPRGYVGPNCAVALTPCTSDADFCSTTNHELCGESRLCECRPQYRNRNGSCEGIFTYQGSANFTSLNQVPLEYTDGLASSLGHEFNDLDQLLRGTLLQVMPKVIDVTFTSFLDGSVIGEFNLIVAEGTSLATARDMLKGSLNAKAVIAGQTIVGIDPRTVTLSDLDECQSDLLNDCSLNAKCTNTEGTYSCACLDGYNDTSPSGAGQGKMCLQDSTEMSLDNDTVSIIIGSVLGIICITFLALLMCWCLMSMLKRDALQQKVPPDTDREGSVGNWILNRPLFPQDGNWETLNAPASYQPRFQYAYGTGSWNIQRSSPDRVATIPGLQRAPGSRLYSAYDNQVNHIRFGSTNKSGRGYSDQTPTAFRFAHSSESRFRDAENRRSELSDRHQGQLNRRGLFEPDGEVDWNPTFPGYF